jgi:heparin/heparan-sulfate lyase
MLFPFPFELKMMKKVKVGFVFIILFKISALAGFAQVHPYVVGDKFTKRLNAGEAQLNAKTAEKIPASNGGNRIVLKANVLSAVDAVNAAPDLVFVVKAPEAGIYEMATRAVPADNGSGLKKDEQGNVVAAYVKIQIDHQKATKRILYDLHQAASQVSGKFELNGKEQQVKIWLPKGLEFDYLEFKNYNSPEIPLKARNYVPKIVPPAGHPRLWVTAQNLPIVRARLTLGENKKVWATVAASAKVPYTFDFNPEKEVFYQEELEKAVQAKAFYYLMTGDKKIGGEAAKLMVGYMTMLEFGNVKHGDITREIGRAIYTGSLVYDWCFDLLAEKDKQLLYDKLLGLAREMEIGWPPFMDSIINGHGNEAQISRDLLAMSIALYDKNPELYKYTSYTILEDLVPMRKFEYESPRHNQGVDYGAYRFGWEMYAVWLYYRMTGLSVFDDNIKSLPYYWLYMRLPDGYMLRDGDMFSVKFGGDRPLYWKQPQTMMLSSAYANDPLIKGEFEREGGLPDNPVLFLLVNDPKLKADHNLSSLPLTKDFGTVLGGMVARTGWDNSETSKDVIAEIKGGGYMFGNHQQADAGALQIYHHGIQVGDIGLYLSYGSAYDYNFNKRSVAHSMMLARDLEEPLLFRAKVRDGGTRFNQRFPLTPQEVTSDPWYDNGKVLSSDFGPSKLKPSFSYFKADLTGAYTSKMSSYTRGFCFLNLGRADVPAVIILTDDMVTAKPEFQKFWQINTLNKPEELEGSLILKNELKGLVGKTHVNMLVPSAANRVTEVLSGKKANSTFGEQFEIVSPKAEANAYRIMVSPKKRDKQNKFLTVFQMAEGDAKPLPFDFKESNGRYQLVIADRVVSMTSGSDLLQTAFTMDIPNNASYEVVLLGMKPGFWNVKQADGKLHFNCDVIPGKNTIVFKAEGGKYIVTPGRVYEAIDLK